GWLTHSSAVVATDSDGVDTLIGSRLDDDVWRRCTQTRPAGHVVDALAAVGVAAMGFDWQILDFRCGERELLLRVSAHADGSTPTSWAGLLDAATSAASTVFDGAARLRMPARIDGVRIGAPPPAVALLHIRHRTGTTTDVSIADESHTVLASITAMTFEELENPGGADTSRMIHRVAWHQTTFDPLQRPAEIVLVGDESETASLAEQLAQEQVATRRCRQVSQVAGTTTGSVVLLVPSPRDSAEATAEVVLHACQQMPRFAAGTRLWVLTRGVHEGDNVTHAPLWGLARVAAAEHPDVWGGVLDLAIDDALPVAVPAALPGHGVVVVRDGVAFTARLADADHGAGVPMSCTPGGTYLITGGTGALGLRVAARLADLGARRLLLLSRRGIPPRRDWPDHPDQDQVRAIAALEERGVSVHVAAVDVAAPGAGDRLGELLEQLPPVRGVVHAAGVEAGALLVNTTADDLRAAMRPKVDGASMLADLFPPGQLDWMVLFSSCGYLAGFPGQGAYACANAYLDAFARHRNARGDRTVSVAWTAWRGLGMGSDSGYIAAQLEALGMGTVGADDAMRALDAAMRREDPNTVVLPLLPEAAAVPMLVDVAPVRDAGA
ncbi:MAG TPA: KR domain-containing protein, partial [Mycobacterium sp.]|nr:KR domain-containing protein [Mycobacterium sp.]